MAATAVVTEVIPLSALEGELHIEESPPNSLPPDIAYCLDSEVEMGGLGGDDRAFVDLFDRGTVEWFDAISATQGPTFPAVVRRRHAAWRASAAPRDAMALDWAGLHGLRWLLDECATGMADAMARGRGADGSPASPSSLLAASPDAARLAAVAGPVVARSVADLRAWGAAAFVEAREALPALYAARSDALRERERAVAEAARARRATAAPRPNSRARREARRREGLARRALARSMAALEGFAGRDRARAWLAGEAVTVEGRRFDFRVRAADLRRTEHGAVEVSVTDKSGIELAALCVYAPSTPALDQVSSLVLHVVAGEEDAIIRSANVIRSTQAATASAAFGEARGRAAMPAPPASPMEREIIDLGAEYREREALVPSARAALGAWLSEGALAPLRDALGADAGMLAFLAPGPDGTFPALRAG